MNLQKIIASLVMVGLLAAAFIYYRWSGVALVLTGLVTWLLVYFNRMMKVLRSAANQPIGHVSSAVMFNAQLKPRMSLLQVIAMTKSLGVAQTPEDTQPEIYRWTDASASHVSCEFMNGKLKKWTLLRPEQPEAAEAAPETSEAPESPQVTAPEAASPAA